MNYYVYILTNKKNGVLYTGYSSDLILRTYQHKEKFDPNGFAERYNATKLVYYEVAGDALGAIAREKQIKGYLRIKKLKMINKFNPEWKDLWDDIIQ